MDAIQQQHQQRDVPSLLIRDDTIAEQLGWRSCNDRVFHGHIPLLQDGGGDTPHQHECIAALDKSLHLLMDLPRHIIAEDETWEHIARAVAALYAAKVCLRRDFDAARE